MKQTTDRKCNAEERGVLRGLRGWRTGYIVCAGSELIPILNELVRKGWAHFENGRYWHFLDWQRAILQPSANAVAREADAWRAQR